MSRDTVTISGAPVKLRELATEADFFRLAKPLEIPVDGLYHAPLLYNGVDVREIMGSWSEDGKPWRPSRVVLSTGTGKPLVATHPDMLLEKAVSEMLNQQTNWDNCLKGMASHVQQSSARECIVFSLGTDHASRGVVAKLRIEYGSNPQM